ncbi:serine/threonine protein kinase [Mucilaginibacter psychrotolerans]|uniref:Serine/threonine protein kinase n=1 Tax=Mucilaginibacter psychrotolerans TaxID=1524096 RepID=A0A4Y8S3N8_9SPHI|nr:serine/threonine-protein kinase [Mucilaginibacter psychrotolerans]TFF33563.1 serine/threonine protein kinase [Mucilaginibacter psychrotolerans]
MGKIFTITAGLENMGALHTGGQGSVYKGKRIGEIYVAVKLLPTPIFAEDENDKHYKDFTNEVEKLKKVNEVANPNVVKILSSGITESGSLPFIEMEFIEGPDLAELLTEQGKPIFTIAETIKVAYQLANALSHCHKVGVKHGDIKSNNVKFNVNTGNYVLLDFGLAIMTGEQRRSSLRNAGAVEFMAPEQSDGELLTQSDVYSYGIILYELLAGTVPFKLNDNGQSARNAVMIAHLDQEPPNMLALRKANMPPDWNAGQRQSEMQVPEWLITLIYKCLQKDPADRYADGTELRQAIQNSVLNTKTGTEGALILQNEKASLQNLLQQEQEKNNTLQQEIDGLKRAAASQSKIPAALPVAANSPATSASKGLLIGIAMLSICIGAALGHYLLAGSKAASAKPVAEIQNPADSVVKPAADTVAAAKPLPVKKHDTAAHAKPETAAVHKKIKKDSVRKTPPRKAPVPPKQPVIAQPKGGDVGKVFSLFTTYAYFHSRPDAASKRAANISQWDNARLRAIDDQNGYIYVTFTNKEGQTNSGWLNKKDLIVVGQ